MGEIGGEQYGYFKISNTFLSHQQNQNQDCNYTTVAYILQNKHESVRVRLLLGFFLNFAKFKNNLVAELQAESITASDFT